MPRFVEIGPSVPERKSFEGFLPYMAWRSSWSCYPDAVNNLSFPCQMRLHIKFGLIGQAVSEEKMFEIADDGRTGAVAWVYYKFTYEPSAQVS